MSYRAQREEAALKEKDPEAFRKLQQARQGAADMMNLFDANLAEMKDVMVGALLFQHRGRGGRAK